MPLESIDWAEHDKAITALVRDLTAQYLVPKNNATPRGFAPVLAFLARTTDQLPKVFSVQDITLTPQLWKDIGSWRTRLAEYQRALREALQVNGDKHDAADFGRRVVLPLLLGWYPGAEAQRAPDVITPVSLAFQVKVKDDNLAAAWHALMNDVSTGVAKTGSAILGALVLGGGLWLGSKLLGGSKD